MKIIVFHT